MSWFAPGAAAAWLRRRDPGWTSSRRAVQSAVVVPGAFAIAGVVGQGQATVFAAFGAFALLLFAQFTGDRATRARSYAALAVAGAALISLASLLYAPVALAVVGMAVVGFAIYLTGAISSTLAASSRAALLAFILPLTFAGGVGVLPERLLGWGIAVALAVPANLFLFGEDTGGGLRRATAKLCRALADLLDTEVTNDHDDRFAAVTRASDELRTTFRESSTRPVNLTTGSRLLAELVEQLEWITATAFSACQDPGEHWPGAARRLREDTAGVLRDIASLVVWPRDRSTTASLIGRRRELSDARRDVRRATVRRLRDTGRPDAAIRRRRGGFERPLYAGHELGFAVGRALDTVADMAAAEQRSWWAKWGGRASTSTTPGEVVAARGLLARRLDPRSVAFQSSLRGALGLAAAVLLARVTGVLEGFWIVLGALSVLRTSAVSTGGTVLRAVLGTALGVGVGAGLVVLIGTDTTVLWVLLPLAVLLAASLSDVVGFAAGQAGFTAMVIILFNLIMSSGATIGLVRIENVALGGGASLIVGLLLWPRGAAPDFGRALDRSYRSAADALHDAISRLVSPAGSAHDGQHADRRPPDEDSARVMGDASRLDDAFRQYIAERGDQHVPLEQITALLGASTRLRFAAAAVDSLADGHPVDARAETLHRPVGALTERADVVTGWYRKAGARVASGTSETADDGSDVPTGAGHGGSFLDAIVPAVESCSADEAADAERLLWAAQYLGDVDRLRSGLDAAVRALAAGRQRRHSWRPTTRRS